MSYASAGGWAMPAAPDQKLPKATADQAGYDENGKWVCPPLPPGTRIYADFTGAGDVYSERERARARAEEEEAGLVEGSFFYGAKDMDTPDVVVLRRQDGGIDIVENGVHVGGTLSPRPAVYQIVRGKLERQVVEVPQADNDNRRPKLLILGHGRHGKDTVAELLRDEHDFTFASSSFFAAERVVRPALAVCGVVYPTLAECYADRVNHRAFWYEAIKAFNGGGKSRLAEEILVDHDIYVGMRSHAEFLASRELFDHVLWVDAVGRGLPPEPRASFDIDYDPETMIWIDNSGTLEDLRGNVRRFVSGLSTSSRT